MGGKIKTVAVFAVLVLLAALAMHWLGAQPVPATELHP